MLQYKSYIIWSHLVHSWSFSSRRNPLKWAAPWRRSAPPQSTWRRFLSGAAGLDLVPCGAGWRDDAGAPWQWAAGSGPCQEQPKQKRYLEISLADVCLQIWWNMGYGYISIMSDSFPGVLYTMNDVIFIVLVIIFIIVTIFNIFILMFMLVHPKRLR